MIYHYKLQKKKTSKIRLFSVDIFEQILHETDNWESFTYCISSEDLNLIHDMSLKIV